MDTTRKIIMFAVGIILAISFIAIGVSIFNRARNNVTTATARYDGLIGDLENDYSGYKANDVIKGSELTSLISQLSSSDGVKISVKTAAAAAAVTYEATNSKVPTKKTDKNYINPAGYFEVSNKTEMNGYVSQLDFVQCKEDGTDL